MPSESCLQTPLLQRSGWAYPVVKKYVQHSTRLGLFRLIVLCITNSLMYSDLLVRIATKGNSKFTHACTCCTYFRWAALTACHGLLWMSWRTSRKMGDNSILGVFSVAALAWLICGPWQRGWAQVGGITLVKGSWRIRSRCRMYWRWGCTAEAICQELLQQLCHCQATIPDSISLFKRLVYCPVEPFNTAPNLSNFWSVNQFGIGRSTMIRVVVTELPETTHQTVFL